MSFLCCPFDRDLLCFKLRSKCNQVFKVISDSCVLMRLHLNSWVSGMLVFTNLKANVNFFSVAF